MFRSSGFKGKSGHFILHDFLTLRPPSRKVVFCLTIEEKNHEKCIIEIYLFIECVYSGFGLETQV